MLGSSRPGTRTLLLVGLHASLSGALCLAILKKISNPHPISSSSSRRGRADATRLCRAARLLAPVARASHSLPLAGTGANGACSSRRVRRLPSQAKPGAGGAGCCWCSYMPLLLDAIGARVHCCCWILLVLARCHSPPAPAPTVESTGTGAPFSMLQIYISSVSKVSAVCCNCFIRMLQK